MTEPINASVGLPHYPLLGRCPMGCAGHSLRADSWGRVACIADRCPRPTAAGELLDLGDTGHVLSIYGPGIPANLTHPIAERLAGQVHDCPLQTRRELLVLTMPAGSYRVTEDNHGELQYERIPA